MLKAGENTGGDCVFSLTAGQTWVGAHLVFSVTDVYQSSCAALQQVNVSTTNQRTDLIKDLFAPLFYR